MTDTRSMSPSRRRFIFLTSVVGLTAVASPLVLPKLLRRMRLAGNLYTGPLVDRVDDLVRRLGRGELTQTQFTAEVRNRYHDLDLQSEFAAWLGDTPPASGEVTLYEMRSLPHRQKMKILYIPAGVSHPPHAHHNLLSVQCVLMGAMHARQYERVQRFDDRTVGLRPATDRIMKPYDCMRTSEHSMNAHWFGADDAPVALLNFNAIDNFADTFEPAKYKLGRYFLDPTVAERQNDLICAPQIETDAAKAKFARQRLSAFPRTAPV